MTTAWTAVDLARPAAGGVAPIIDPATVPAIAPELVFWDFWPVTGPDGRVARVAAGELWMALSAPIADDPLARHGLARIRLLTRDGASWRDEGNAMPDGHAPGSREWSGSAILEADRLTLFFTAAGRRGEARATFEQRLFKCSARLAATSAGPRLLDWAAPVESVAADGTTYLRVDQAEGAVGSIKAFRDPWWFRDPRDGAAYLLFTGSLAASHSTFNGAIGLARVGENGRWRLQPPLVHADGVNNELERPHLVMRDGLLYLFWSTQREVFAPGIDAPTGLYGMVGATLDGPFQPLNGSGLVIANPPEAPLQAYSWHVAPDLNIVSFVDRPDGHFVGRPAPDLQLRLDGDRADLVQSDAV